MKPGRLRALHLVDVWTGEAGSVFSKYFAPHSDAPSMTSITIGNDIVFNPSPLCLLAKALAEAPGLQVQGAQSRHSAIKSRIIHLGTLAFGYVESRSLLPMYHVASCGRHSYTYPRWPGLTPRGKITTM